MSREIKQAAVLGSGTMGSRLAAHLANAGIDCLLLDLKSEGRDPNAVVNKAMKGLTRAKPPAYFTPGTARRIQVGNFEDDLPRLADADWILEAVIEKLEPKQELLAKVDQHRKPGSICTSNTSGIPIASLAEGRSSDMRRHWLGTHFFNPPRHMRLVEIIPGPDTSQETLDFTAHFCDRRLGKVVVFAKDRPNFIANRIFLFAVMHTIKTMLKLGLSVEEVDALTGPLIGRPRMATFRLADFTGIDVCLYITQTLHQLIPDDEKRGVYLPPKFLQEMVAQGAIGDKTGHGFYKKDRKAPGGRLVFDIERMDYREMRRPEWPLLAEAGAIRDPAERIGKLISSEEAPGKFLWETLSELFLYTAARIPEISDDILSVDTTMRSGFNWDFGLFEIWSQLGVEETAARMRSDGKALPPLVEKVLATPERSFYGQRNSSLTCFDVGSGAHRVLKDPAGVLRLSTIRRKKGVLKTYEGGRLLDLGDGVACLEFSTKSNSLTQSALEAILRSVEELKSNHQALVVGNEGAHFCAGANLDMLLEYSRTGKFEEIGKAVDLLDEALHALRDCSKPTVAAPFSYTVGGGCSLAMFCGAVQAAAETYMGFVETGVGLIPAGGGGELLLRRHTAELTPEDNVIPPSREVFQMIGLGKVSNSAAEAREWRLMRSSDGITMNKDRLLADAKQLALSLAVSGYEPPAPAEILVGGSAVIASLKVELYMMRQAEYISGYDVHIGRKLAHVLAGGELSQPGYVSERYLLGLAREAFLSLCGEEKTQQRMEHMLKTGKPLRN